METIIVLLLILTVSLASVTEPNGLSVPINSGVGETQLNQLFATLGEAIDWRGDASKTPSTWTLNDQISVKYLLRMAGMVSGLAWYNADGSSNPTLYTLIPAGASVGYQVSGQDIYNSPNYLGGAIGFALITATQQKYYSEDNLNPYCTNCAQPGYWTLALKYRSTLDPYSYYLCWEDGGATSSAWNNDGDFNDDVFLVSGIAPSMTTHAVSLCGNGIVENGEACDGGDCCTSSCTFASSATTCRASAGACDVAETCDGWSASCPVDSFSSPSIVCRQSVGPCDPKESCSGFDASCPEDVSGSFETTCPGLFVEFDGQQYSWLNYDVISFNNFISNFGDVEGRLAVKNTASIGWGYSIGYEVHGLQTDETLPYSLVVGGSLYYGSGAVYPDGSNSPHAGAKENIFVGSSFSGPDYIGDSVTGSCDVQGCLDASFDALQACYGSYQQEMANHADNVASLIEWSGLHLTCNDPDATAYYVTLQAYQMDSYTWIDINNCNSDARWVINIPGTDDVSFSGGSFPGNAASVVYNILGSGRNVRLGATQLVGTILSPYNKFWDVGSVVLGKVIAGDIATSHQTNRAQCFIPHAPSNNMAN